MSRVLHAGDSPLPPSLPLLVSPILALLQLLEQYGEQVQWQSEIRHEAISFPPMEKMIADYQVRDSGGGVGAGGMLILLLVLDIRPLTIDIPFETEHRSCS